MAKSPISGNLYNGGAVTFNPAPYDAFTAQIYARKQAKEEALDNYYRDLDKSVATAGNGMRSQDQAGLWQNENARQQHYLKNRDAILNPRIDNGKAQSENMALYQHSLALANQSKAAAKTDEQLHPLLADPDKKRRFSDANTEALHQQSLPVNDPNHKDFDFGQIQFEPKEIDFNDVDKKVTEGIKPQINPTAVVKDPLTGTMTEGKKFSYTPDDLNTMYQRNVALMHSNVDFHDKTLDLFKDKDLRTQLNPVFKEKFGHDITTPEDMAMAGTLNRIQLQHTESNTKEDAFGKSVELANINHQFRLAEQANRFGHEKTLLKLKQDYANEGDDKKAAAVGGFVDGLLQDADKSPTHTYSVDGGGKYDYHPLQVSPAIKNLFIDSKKYPADEIGKASDGTIQLIRYRRDAGTDNITVKNGQKIVDNDASGKISKEEFQDVVTKGLFNNPTTMKQLQAQQAAKQQKPTTPPPKTKATKSSKNPLGLDGL